MAPRDHWLVTGTEGWKAPERPAGSPEPLDSQSQEWKPKLKAIRWELKLAQSPKECGAWDLLS